MEFFDLEWWREPLFELWGGTVDFKPASAFGWVAQAMFFSRFLVQWLASERLRRSHVPTVFWWISLIGGMMMLAYGLLIGEAPIYIGQIVGVFVYSRNLMLIRRHKESLHP